MTRFERELTLRRKPTGGGAKTAVNDKNIRKVDKILDQSPRRSVRNIAKRAKLSATTVWRILRKELSKYPYKIQLMQEQTAANKQERVDFAKQFADKIESDNGFLKNLIVSDEAHFELSGWVNTQNARIWSDKQPYETVDSPKSREKVTVWMGLSYHGVFGPHFFEDDDQKAETVRTANYIAMLREKVIPVLKRKKIFDSCIFQQDGAPPHCSNDSMAWLREHFGERLISRKAEFKWPPYSPDLNPADFFLWGYLKDRVYSNPAPKTVEELKRNIKREAKKLKPHMVKSAIDNMLPRVQNTLSRKGAWFEKFLKY